MASPAWTCNQTDRFGVNCNFTNTHGGIRCAMCDSYKTQQSQNKIPLHCTQVTQPVKIEMEIDESNDSNHTAKNKKYSQNRRKRKKRKKKSSSRRSKPTKPKPVKTGRIHKYASKSNKSRRKRKKQKTESFQFTFIYPNAHKLLFGNDYIPLIQQDECDENIFSFINTKLKEREQKVELIDEYIDGLECSLLKHQQFGVGWLIKMEQNELFRGGYLCDDMGVGKTIQIIALMLLTKNNKKYTVKYSYDNKYEYFKDFDDEDDDDLSGFIVHDNNIDDDQDYEMNMETDQDQENQEKYSYSDDSDIQIINLNKQYDSYYSDDDDDGEPDLKRRKLNKNDALTQMVNNHFLEKTRQIKKQRTLIIVPVCILKQWDEEISDKAPDQFNTLIYHGPHRKKRKLVDLLQYDVIITTYETIMYDYNHGNDENYENTFFSYKMKGFFYRIVLDEAQFIKNPTGVKSRAVAVLGNNGCKMHWVSTGTPIQNGLCDLFALGRFLQMPKFNNLKIFKDTFRIKDKDKEKASYNNIRVSSFLSVVMLRRLKNEVIDDLVSKTEEWIEIDFKKELQTRVLYDKYEENAREELEFAIEEGSIREHWNNILIQLMRLRQICSNPDIAKVYTGICKHCGDIVDKPYKIVECGHLFCAEHLEELNGKCPHLLCKVKFDFDEYSEDIIDLPDKKPLFSAKWRRLIEENNGTMVRMNLLNEKFGDDISSIIGGYLYENYGKRTKIMDAYVIRRRLSKAKGMYADKSEFDFDIDGMDIDMDMDDMEGEWNDIHEDVLWNKEFKDDTLKYYEKDYLFAEPYDFTFIPSAKTMIMIKKILSIRKEKPKDKILIYSQWTTMLDLIEFVLGKYEIGYYRYDGSLKYKTRSEIINNFKEDCFDDRKILLISLKCGAVGLNLMTANHVIFIDLWWNPAVEAQAIDRVHRIGQNKHVFVTRFVIKNSVQDRMLQIQDEKKQTADFALNGAKLLKANTMNINMVRRLFG